MTRAASHRYKQQRRPPTAVPREVFLGSHLYRQNRDPLWEPVSRGDPGEEDWLHLAYADKTLATQIDGLGAAAATTPRTGRPTSSGEKSAFDSCVSRAR
ncbi:hypothetical protein [Streptomyces sp. OE57]|uniref:hypothetical protein n=1 Tax=Streptomyces lacaronensis TaxID=3379885 RepID=UPI0039B79144